MKNILLIFKTKLSSYILYRNKAKGKKSKEWLLYDGIIKELEFVIKTIEDELEKEKIKSKQTWCINGMKKDGEVCHYPFGTCGGCSTS